MTRQLIGALALLVALTCAQAPQANARGARGASAADRVEALAAEASKLVRAGQFHRGIARYEDAYRIEPAAALLYNIAFVYDRKLDDPRSAREYYERYLVAPDAEADGSARARDRLLDLNARIRELDSPPPPRPESAPIPSAAGLHAVGLESSQGDSWGWALLGTGAVAIAVGTGFHHMAGESADLANRSQGTDRTILAARVKDQELIGWSALGLGAASALTGGLLFLLSDEPSTQAAVDLQPILEPGVAGLRLGARW